MSLQGDARKLDGMLAQLPPGRIAALRKLAADAVALLDATAAQFPDGEDTSPLAEATEDLVISVVMAMAKSKLIGGAKGLGDRLRAVLATCPTLTAVAGDLLGRLG